MRQRSKSRERARDSPWHSHSLHKGDVLPGRTSQNTSTQSAMAHCAFFLIAYSLVLPCVRPTTAGTQGPVLDCIPIVSVPRNTVWRAAPMQTLKINCTVIIQSYCWKRLTLSWCKVDDGNNCRPLNHSIQNTTEYRNISGEKGILFLVFSNLSAANSGLYRCKIDANVSTVSHNINVTVTDSVIPTGDGDIKVESNQTNPTESTGGPVDQFWPYIYICGGILLVVATVMITSLLIIRVKRPKKSKNVRVAENRSTAAQVDNLPLPIKDTVRYQHGNTQSLPPHLSPSCIYDIPPSRASSHKVRPSGRRAANQAVPVQRHDQSTVEEEEDDSPLVYASLNHKAASRAPTKVSHSELENSEYAAIKIN